MDFRGCFIKEIDDLGENIIPDSYAAQKGHEERIKIFNEITRVIKEVATQNRITLDEKTLIQLVAEFAYCLGKNNGYFWDAAEWFQPYLAQVGVRWKNYKLVKIRSRSEYEEHVWVKKESA